MSSSSFLGKQSLNFVKLSHHLAIDDEPFQEFTTGNCNNEVADMIEDDSEIMVQPSKKSLFEAMELVES